MIHLQGALAQVKRQEFTGKLNAVVMQSGKSQSSPGPADSHLWVGVRPVLAGPPLGTPGQLTQGD